MIVRPATTYALAVSPLERRRIARALTWAQGSSVPSVVADATELLACIGGDIPLSGRLLEALRVTYVRWLKSTGADEPYRDPIAAALNEEH